MIGNFWFLIFLFGNCLVISMKYSSIIWRTSGSSTKDISKSTWVNSGWRSHLGSSSRKHLAIWIYLSYHATISICLYCCGDCGSTKNFPWSNLAGTTNSRDHSGVFFVKHGVSKYANPLLWKNDIVLQNSISLVIIVSRSDFLLRSR